MKRQRGGDRSNFLIQSWPVEKGRGGIDIDGVHGRREGEGERVFQNFLKVSPFQE